MCIHVTYHHVHRAACQPSTLHTSHHTNTTLVPYSIHLVHLYLPAYNYEPGLIRLLLQSIYHPAYQSSIPSVSVKRVWGEARSCCLLACLSAQVCAQEGLSKLD
ncbi:hypothetical protein EJ04DRAFT_88616 [Polyplosphaeria fusca]|uniref:Uncharacterized protein n=1 Tax=Polyplosphaeria fusca TaxID=682080 RepID=A0A9P4QNT9_9PLEO|nr:hypothetical protein EJ04DRAFT_88616 [Polyplosphaeria fusca]